MMGYVVWLADILTDAGLTIRPYSGWETRGANDFAPRGVILHHTVTSPATSDATVDRVLAITGSSKVPPPLANYSTNRDGTVSIIAAGTTNHGGVGSWNGVSGNRHWFGDEMKNLGTSAEPWSGRQLESARVAAAAVLAHIGADESWLVGHKEYATPPGRKVDPHTLNMSTERQLVRQLLQPEDPMSLPVDTDSHKEQVRHVQEMLGVAASGTWDFKPAVSALAQRSGTGDPKGLDGSHVNGRMYTQLLSEFIGKQGQAGVHDHDGRYVKNVSVSR